MIFGEKARETLVRRTDATVPSGGDAMRDCRLVIAILVLVLPSLGCPDNSQSAEKAVDRGQQALSNKDLDRAIEEFSEAIRLDPNNAAARAFRGGSYVAKGEYDKAIGDLNEAQRLRPDIVADPRCSDFYRLRGQAFQGKKEYRLAIADYDQAIRQRPRAAYYNQLAWLLATCPEAELRDGKRAVALATRACELSDWKEGGMIDTLAAANAECGNFKEAVKWQKKAVELGNDDKEEEKKSRERLRLYEGGKPYREE